MREDMSEVIIERPRYNSRAGYPRKMRRRDADATWRNPESLGFGAGIAAFGSSKSLNENLAPLRRYLERQVNRPWDKVWSEICANLKPSSTVQQHVRDHIADFVAIKTYMKDGAVYVAGRRLLDRHPHRLAQSNIELYVDPRSGLLRRNKYFKTYKQQKTALARELKQRMRETAPNVQAHRFGDRGWWARN